MHKSAPIEPVEAALSGERCSALGHPAVLCEHTSPENNPLWSRPLKPFLRNEIQERARIIFSFSTILRMCDADERG